MSTMIQRKHSLWKRSVCLKPKEETSNDASIDRSNDFLNFTTKTMSGSELASRASFDPAELTALL